MRLGADHVRVRVPATSANLGPGFDAFGIALGLVRRARGAGARPRRASRVEVTGEGAGQVPDDEQHLVVSSLRAALDQVGASQTGLHLVCHNRIPHGRGLGSSAAAVVAGIVAARGLIAEPEALSDDVAIDLAARIEGHPDNAAPAVLGGATLAWSDDGRFRAIDLAVARRPSPRSRSCPPNHLSTKAARGVLPATVPHADAAFQAGRAALLVEALGRRPELLLTATQDRLHQEYRRSVMPRLARARRRAAGRGRRRRGVGRRADGAGARASADRRRRRPTRTTPSRAAFGGAMGGWQILPLAGGLATGATVQRVT